MTTPPKTSQIHPPEVVDLSADPQLGWIAECLTVAKTKLAASGGALAPLAFFETPDGRLACPLEQIGNINVAADRDVMAAVLRKMARELNATGFVFISDSFNNQFATDTAEGQRAFELYQEDPRIWRSWSPEYKQLVGFRRRECIYLAIELPGDRKLVMCQFYRLEASRTITFEEFVKMDAHDAEGRFHNVLPPVKRKITEEEWSMLEWLMTLNAGTGYHARLGSDGLQLLRPDGTVFAEVAREVNPQAFERLVDICRRGGQLKTDGS